LTNIAGTNLSIDSAGNLNASGGGGGSGAWVEGDNTSLLEPVSKDGIEVDTIADNGSGSVTMNSTLDLNGNNVETSTSGLTVTTNDTGDLTLDPGANNNLVLNNQQSNDASILTIDGSGNVGRGSKSISHIGGGGSSSELVTSGDVTAFRVVDGEGQSPSTKAPNVIGGHPDNNTGSSVPDGAVIGGGGTSFSPNKASGDSSTISGGKDNTASGTQSTVAGGVKNTASGDESTVGGGVANTASSNESTVAGGNNNTASASRTTVGGGVENTASGNYSTVPGGEKGAAESDNSFVFNDGTGYHSVPPFSSNGLSSDNAVDDEGVTGSHTFSVSAKNGFRFITGGASSPNVTYIDSNGKFVSSGGVDAQGGTVENSTGDLILSSSGDIQVQPSTETNYTIEGASEGDMNKDPTSTSPDGFIQIDVGGTTCEIPFYNANSPT
jgi:hypothetical protein